MSVGTTEYAPAPGGHATPAGGTCVPCNTGTVELTTKKLAVCWDTGEDGLEAEDHPLGGVRVRLVPTGGGTTLIGTSGTGPEEEEGDGRPLGELTIGGVAPGEYEIRATKRGFHPPLTPPTVTVEVGAAAEAEVSLKRAHLECDRKHPNSPGINDGPFIWLPIAWLPWNEPWVLILRDIFWFTALAFVIAGLATLDMSMTALSSIILGLLSGVVFGTWLGLPTLLAAFASFVILVIGACSASITEALGIDIAQPVPLAGAAAGWICFLLAFCIGRVEPYKRSSVIELTVGAAGLGLVVGLLVALFASQYDGWATFFGALLGLAWGAIGGLFGHTFVNEGQTDAQHWKRGGFKMPFAGTRYCVQGPRGFISHYKLEEFSYDWAMPEGEPVLAAKDGHVIMYKEDKTGTEAFDGNPDANHVKVRHEDGSVAYYLHGKQGGVTSINPDLEADSVEVTVPRRNKPDLTYRRMTKWVFVQQGQHLCRAGNVGISMFSHIHFTVKRGREDPINPGDASNYIPIRFDDSDTDDGRCWSMRRYLSENVNRGAIQFPPSATGGYPPR